MDDSAFIAQMAQFSSLQQSQQMATDMSAMRRPAAECHGRLLSRRMVTVADPQNNQTVNGSVSAVDTSGTAPKLLVNGALLRSCERPGYRVATGGNSLDHAGQTDPACTHLKHRKNSQPQTRILPCHSSELSAAASVPSKLLPKDLKSSANNIANVNTTGYKSNQSPVRGQLQQPACKAPPPPTPPTPTWSPPKWARACGWKASLPIFNQGELSTTGKTTDLGISGGGFFVVSDPQTNSKFVTRAGDFRVDDKGYLVTQQGFRVQGLNDGSTSYTVTGTTGNLVYTENAPVAPARSEMCASTLP